MTSPGVKLSQFKEQNKSNFRKQKQKKISGQQQQQLKCMRIAAAFTHKEDSTK